MKTRWLKNVPQDEEDKVREYYLQSLQMRKLFRTILDEEIESVQNDMLSEKHLDSPNWNLIQVDRVSRMKTLNYVKSLIQ